MPLEQAGVPPNAARRSTDLNAWMGLLPPKAGVAAHGPTPVPAPIPVTGYTGSSAVVSAHSPTQARPGSRSSYDDDQDEISRQLLMGNQHRSASSILPPTLQETHIRNGLNKSLSRSASPAHQGSRHSPSQALSAPAPLLTTSTSRQLSHSLPSRLQQSAVASSSAMEIDELANSDGDDEIDLVPLVMSDLDPQFPKAAATQKETPTPPAARSAKSAHLSGLSIRHPTTPHKTNGVNKTSSTAAVRQPIVTIPLASTTPTAHRPHTSTPKKEVPTAASVSLPALYTPKKNDTDSGTSVPQPPDSPENAPASAKTKSPIVAVGRRSKKVSDVRIKGGRPKGWKPGMSYREVALRNLGVDPNDPSLPPKVLLPPRPRGRPPGRPRLPGRPKVKPTQSLGFKRIGRPPIQSIDAVQRSIFLNNQACFAPFMCEWAGCHAELQNMATLRKHVAVVHGRPASAVKTCQWRKCASRVPRVEYKDSADTDADGRTLLEHIEYQHLTPLSWHRGDGFANNGHTGPPEPPAAAALLTKSRSRDEAKLKTKDDAKASATIPAASFYTGASAGTAPEMSLDGIPSEDLPRYLLDDEGKQVTPLLRDTVLESSPTFWTQEERGRRLKDLYRLQQQHLNKRPDRSLGRMI